MYPISFFVHYCYEKSHGSWQRHRQLTDLDFADDIAMMAENDVVCQEMTTHLQEKSAQVGL